MNYLMKSIIKIILLLFIVSLLSCSNKSKNVSSADNKKYNKIEFGKQNDKPVSWYIVLDDGTYQILMSEKVLDVKLYNETNIKMNFENTTLYDYLNSDFINEYFSKEEREKMAFINFDNTTLATLPTTDNLIDLFGTLNYIKIGFYGDKSFYAPNINVLAYPAENAINNDIDPYDNETFSEYERKDIDQRYEFANGAVPYWLLNQNADGTICYVTSTGYIGVTEADTGYIGIRPVIKIKKS